MNPDLKAALKAVVDAIERLLTAFRLERIVYLCTAAAGFCLLVYGAVEAMRANSFDVKTLTALFGSGGLITLASLRVTYMFNKAFSLVEKVTLHVLKHV